MNLTDAINHPDVNAFDITNGEVITYKKPGEPDDAFKIRHEKNIKKAIQIRPTLKFRYPQK